jgi:hypothetical protein
LYKYCTRQCNACQWSHTILLEELEANVEEINKKDAAQQDKIKELRVFIEKLIRFSVANVSVVIALAAITYIFVKL